MKMQTRRPVLIPPGLSLCSVLQLIRRSQVVSALLTCDVCICQPPTNKYMFSVHSVCVCVLNNEVAETFASLSSQTNTGHLDLTVGF